MASNKDQSELTDSWECKFCHFYNPGQLRPGGSCQICEAWSCTHCTYVNYPRNRRCSMCQSYTPCSTVRLLLFGNTRSTREAVADMILGGRHPYPQFVSTIDRTRRQGRRISVVNTPDMSNPDMSEQKKSDEIYKFLAMSAPGPHAFVLVRKGKTFTEEDRQSFEWYSSFFGNKIKNHLLMASYICDGNSDTEEFEQCDDLQSIPFIPLGDYGGEEEIENGVCNLLRTVDDLIEKNGYFQNELFENVTRQKSARLHKEKEEKENLEMELAKTLSLDDNERPNKCRSHERPSLEETSDSTRRQVYELQERIQRCEAEIKSLREKSTKTGSDGDWDWSKWLPLVTKVGEQLLKYSLDYMSAKFLK